MHRVDNEEVVLDGSYLACAYAGMLCKTDLEVSGTHNSVSVDGLSVDTTSKKSYYNKLEQEQLLDNSIIPISLVGDTILSVRSVTTLTDQTSVFFDEVIVDITDEVTSQVETYLNSVIGRPNTAQNRAIYSARVDGILTTLRNQGIIEEFSDSVLTRGDSPDTFIAEVSIRPTYNTNFVYLTISVN